MTVGRKQQQIDWHTFGHPFFSHVDDGSHSTMAKPAVPGFDVGNSCIEGSRGDRNFGLLMVLDVWSFCRENVEAFRAGENATNENCVAFVGDPAPVTGDRVISDYA
jgi:hypothetical protein